MHLCTWTFPRALAFAVFFLFLSFLENAAPLISQVTNGVSGVVTDTSGSAVAGAHVTIKNLDTGVVFETTTSSAGTYVAVGLLPGGYSITFAAPNFASSETSITVEVATISTANAVLKPGSITETVHVNESSLTLNTETPEIGATLEPELVDAAPIEISGLARQIDSFSYLAPGVQGNAGSHTINGGVTFENEVQFNGIPVVFVQFQGNQTYINPPYEAVNEFRISSSTFSAQFGLGQGAVTFNMASGTNAFHGDAFEILRNQLFDSPGFFPTRFNTSGKPQPPIDQENNYGFTLGGPILVPRLYNGHNRTFFHFSGDWYRQNQALTALGTVPSKAMKQGDFGEFTDSNGTVIPIYDPTTGKPFPLNHIPEQRFSSLAKTLLPLIPDSDTQGLNNSLISNKLPALSSIPVRQFLWSYTVDENLSASQSIHFSQWSDSYDSDSFTSSPIVAPTNALQSEYTYHNTGTGMVLNYTKTFSPNLVMTAGVDAIWNVIGKHNADNSVSFAGVDGGTTLPLIEFDGQNQPTAWGVGSNEWFSMEGGLTINNNRMLGLVGATNLLWTRARHTFNLGFQTRRSLQDIIDCAFCSGTFSFSQRSTSTPDSSDPNFGAYGSSFASFLLGEADAATRVFASETRLRSKAFALYLQDDVKLTNRLTLNAGLRYDILVPFTEDHNNILFIDRTAPNSGADGLLGTATKFGDCTGCAGITRADIHWTNWQPRLGFSYQLTPKTVLQSGFYLTYLNGGAYEFGTAFAAAFMSTLTNGSFLRSSNGGSTPSYGDWDTQTLPRAQQTPFSPTIGNGGVIFDFPYRAANSLPYHPVSGSVGTAPYDQAWSAGIQRELPWNMMMSVAYVGNRAIHLPTTLEISNQPNPSVLQYGSLLGDNILDPAVVAAGFTPPYSGFVNQYGGSATLEQALTPYPQFGEVYPSYEMDGSSFYNALQVQAEKRFSDGLSYLANATFSRLLANTQVGSGPYSTNGMNAYNPKPEWGPSWLDQPYNIKAVATYALPIGPKQRFLNKSGVAGALIGGWQVSAIVNYAGGYAFGPTNNYNPLLVNSFDRPNLLPGVPLTTYSYKRSKDFFVGKTPVQPVQFSTSAFQNTGPWELGNAKRSYAALRTPRYLMENLDAIKSFKLGEHLRASLRVDYFNAFNRTQFQAPDNNSLDSAFGQITNLSSQIGNRQGQATFRVEF